MAASPTAAPRRVTTAYKPREAGYPRLEERGVSTLPSVRDASLKDLQRTIAWGVAKGLALWTLGCTLIGVALWLIARIYVACCVFTPVH